MKQSIFVSLVAIVLVACVVNSIEASDPLENLDTYYPLTPRTLTYDYVKKGSNDSITRQITIQKSINQDGTEVVPSVISSPDLKFTVTRFIQKKSDGVYIKTTQIGNGEFSQFDVPIPILKVPIKKGIFFDSDVKLSPNSGGPSVTSHYTYSIEDTNSDITVPYGKFTNCIKLKIIIRGNDRINESTSWLAPKTGLVRVIEIMKLTKTNDVAESEMLLKKVDYNTPAVTAQTPAGPVNKERGAADWLTDNSVANMKGLDFLLLYAGIIVAALIFGWLFIRNADATGQELPRPLPPDPDPYELAYLRGGVEEVIRLAIFKLVQARSLVSSGKDLKIMRADDSVPPSGMSDMERIVYEEVASPQWVRSVCKRLSPEFKERCAPLEQRLSNDRLLTDRAVTGRARLVRMALLSVIILLGGYKLGVALSRGHTDVILLVVLAIIGVIVTIVISKAPLLSRRGSNYLKELRAKLKDERGAAVPETGIENPNLTLLVALFGFGVLKGTAYAQYLNVLAPGRSSSDDSYIGVGDGSSGGGGGCGGCGGNN